MPVSFPEFSGESDRDPRPTLADFLTTLQKFLAELVDTNHDPQGRPLFLESLRDDMRAAWNEAQPHFAAAIARVNNAVFSLSANNPFYEHGLYGRQLRFKLAVIAAFNQQYLAIGKGILRKLIDIIDDLLKCILDAIGAGGAISEIKDFIKDSLDD
jgi:hypothetical protein